MKLLGLLEITKFMEICLEMMIILKIITLPSSIVFSILTKMFHYYFQKTENCKRKVEALTEPSCNGSTFPRGSR